MFGIFSAIIVNYYDQLADGSVQHSVLSYLTSGHKKLNHWS